ncbi:tRNA (guanosine(18)-2'-O)-methyltransferase [Maudiozyma humilis]|uniref:tRNA (Guanosine(18)-2'-O)-methyltransferase n=1 Tax=Maudiozyma humilis TaxID=51915 RepID=A0AAV5RQJ7_MAUHU|nr:tRNA (guanosine(18)-2'-O)-methyltransferase [Kazachstania humilis]
MSSKESFISKYLSSEQQISLIGDLISEKKFDEVVEIVTLTNVDLSKEDAIIAKLFNSFTTYIKSLIDTLDADANAVVFSTEVFSDPQMEHYITLINCIPCLWSKFYNWLATVVEMYIKKENTNLFDEEYYKEIEQKLLTSKEFPEMAYSIMDDQEVVALLYLLEKIYLSDISQNREVNFSMDGPLIALLNANNEMISVASSKLMRWKYVDIFNHCQNDDAFDTATCNVLSYIYSHLGPNDWKERNALCLQLRILTEEEITKSMLQFIETDEYWAEIQRALNHKIHENRKLGLSILKLSIKKLLKTKKSIYTECFKWNPELSEKYLDSWKRFTTLYEIVSLDTSLNQIQAAYQDILSLFEDACIDSSWSMILFSTGLTASMESVRKYMLSLVFRIHNPAVLGCELNILRDNILTSAMQASYYNVYDNNCPYGTDIVKFVSNLIKTSTGREDIILTCMFELLIKEGSAFDPARIYMALGILNFFQTSQKNMLNTEHLAQLRKLFEFECEDEMLEVVLQKIYLDMLQYVSSVVDVKVWLETIRAHIICVQSDYQYLGRSYTALKDFALTSFKIDENVLKSYTNLEYLVYIFFDIPPSNVTVNFLREICSSGIVSVEPFRKDITDAINFSISHDDIANSEVLILIESIKDDRDTLQNLQEALNFDSLLSNFSIDNFKVISLITKLLLNSKIENSFVNMDQFLKVYEKIADHYRKNRTIKSFSVKDETFQLFFQTVYSMLEHITPLNSSLIEAILPIMLQSVSDDNGHYNGNLAVAKLITLFQEKLLEEKEEFSFKSILESSFQIISIIWENVTSERLVLKEKSLHVEIIRSMFHETFLNYALRKDDEFANELRTTICVYAEEISNASASRRGLLPIVGEQLCKFSKSQEMSTFTDINYTWIISIFVCIIKQSQSEHNIFKLKPIIAAIYDHELTTESDTQDLYDEFYGEPEITVHIHMVDAIHHFDNVFKKQFISFILLDTSMLAAIRRNDGAEEKERLKLWQFLLLSLSLLGQSGIDAKSCNAIFNSIDDEPSPLVRLYKEWTVAFIFASHLKQNKSTDDEKFLFDLVMDSPKPATVVSTEKIIYLVLTALLDDENYDIQSLLRKFLCALVPNSSSNKPLVRHFSNSLIISFWPTFKSVIPEGTLRTIIENLFAKAKETQIVGQFRAGDANVWHLYRDLTLTSIFGGIIRRMTDHEMPFISKDEFVKYIPGKSSDIVIGEDEFDAWLSKRDDKGTSSNSNKFESDVDGSSPLQTKSGAWETVLDLDNKKSNETVHRSDLIVVSSLVDKPPNLGGICRLCDVLGVGLLTVQDIRVKNHPQFKNVAVTADKWMPMEEVPIDGIIEFMKSKKREGYTLIGLEQTDKSVKLDDHYRFPKKSLILLGTEAHGIPGNLLSELDLCLEIQQFGVIRSMNIQTATAVIVHSYTIQHM